ncbi:MAG TPA: hypothetical protein VGN37_02200 [Actinocatenispora sp.]
MRTDTHHRRHRIRRGALAVAGGAALLGAAAVPALADTTPDTASPAGAARPTTVTLPTGDQVLVTPGRPALLRSAAGGGSHQYTTADGHLHVVPAVAQPYLGRLLDPSLFDVTALAGTGRTPVSLTYAAGRTPAAPPGITLTATDRGTARGYVSSGRRLAAALRTAIGADVRAGRQPGSTPVAAGLTGVTRTGATPHTAAQPRYPMHTLEIHVADKAGAPATMYVFVDNVDDLTRLNASTLAVDGVARIAVPAGHYDLSTQFAHYDETGTLTESRLIDHNDLTVPDAAGTTTVTLDERDSTVPVSVATPRASTPAMVNALYTRQDTAGHGFVSATTTDGAPVYVNAQPAPPVGSLHYVVAAAALGTEPGPAYRYDVAFGFPDVPAEQHLRVAPDTLATVRHGFLADPAATDTTGMLYAEATGDTLGSVASIAIPAPAQTMPGELTQYLGTADGGGWRQAVLAPAGMPMFHDVQTVVAGRAYATDWFRGPLAPGFAGQDGDAACGACVAGDTLSLVLAPWTDGTAGSAGSPPGKGLVSHLVAYRNDERIADLGTGQTAVRVTGLTGAATYRLAYDQDISGAAGISQSTVTHTDVSVPYAPGAGDPLPADDTCVGQAADAPCRILPALTLGYRLAGDEHNTVGGATARMGLTVGHLTYRGAGSRAAITSVTVQLSTDGGTTWTPATVAGGAGHYRVSWPNPAAGSTPTLRVTATDAAGGRISQTVTAAYTVGSR